MAILLSFIYLKTGSCYIDSGCPLTLCSPGWQWICGCPPASGSSVLGLQICAPRPGLFLFVWCCGLNLGSDTCLANTLPLSCTLVPTFSLFEKSHTAFHDDRTEYCSHLPVDILPVFPDAPCVLLSLGHGQSLPLACFSPPLVTCQCSSSSVVSAPYGPCALLPATHHALPVLEVDSSSFCASPAPSSHVTFLWDAIILSLCSLHCQTLYLVNTWMLKIVFEL